MHDFRHCLGDFILMIIFCKPFLYSINRRGIPPMREHLGEYKYLGSRSNKVLVLL
ncbi:hypothetical protein GIB67_024281, partial [Kingdonia uniflora]